MTHVDNNHLNNLIQQARGVIALYTTPGATLRVLYSGGKDSTVVAHLASTMPGFAGVAHVRTRTGPASWVHSERVLKAAEANGWNCLVGDPTFVTYPMLIARFGFPGPAMHNIFYQYLKGRAIAKLSTEARKRDKKKRIIWLTGIRWEESPARKKAPELRKESGAEWWVNPILSWTDADIRAYVDRFGLIVDSWSHSVDCQCGAHSHPEEHAAIDALDAQQSRYIALLEQLARVSREIQLLEVDAGMRDAGLVIPEEFCTWGHGLNATRLEKQRENSITICNRCGVLNEVLRQRADKSPGRAEASR